jgi:hypothetical protein
MEGHLKLPAQLFFDGSPAGRIGLLDPPLNVVSVTVLGLVELDFDLARDFEQAAVDRSELLADSSDEFQCHMWLRSLR